MFEDYNINDIYNWWSGIKIHETPDYYIIQLKNVYLTNKIMQLQKGLKGKVVRFFSKDEKKYIEDKIENVELSNFNELFFKIKGIKNQNITHTVETHFSIEISKLYIEQDKFNL